MEGDHDLTLGDIKNVFDLIRKVCDRWDDPKVWREHLLNGICELTDSAVGSIVGQSFSAPGTFESPVPIAIVGMPPEIQKAIFQKSIDKTDHRSVDDIAKQGEMPGAEILFGKFQREGSVTLRREEMTDDQTFYASSFWNDFRKPAGCDDYLISIRAVDFPTRFEVMTIDRRPGEARFVPRDVVLLKFLHDEIAPLIGTRLTTEAHLSRDGLSARLRETLSHLLEGDGEKQIARKMNLSPTTVHEYIGMLYKHFHVSSRPEFMAYFIRREPRLRES